MTKEGGRPGPRPKDIDWAKLDNLCNYNVSLDDCAFQLNVSRWTLNSKIKKRFGIEFSTYKLRNSLKLRVKLENECIKRGVEMGSEKMLELLLINKCGYLKNPKFSLEGMTKSQAISELEEILIRLKDSLPQKENE